MTHETDNMTKSVLWIVITSLIIIFGQFFYDSRLIVTAQIVFPNDETEIPNFGRCITPSGERALCIILQDCKYLYNVLITSPLRDDDRLYLSRSQCGSRNGKVLICCPDRYRQLFSNNNQQNQQNQQRITQIQSEISNNLLPEPGQCGSVLSNRIYGGNKTKIDEFPWMALIEYTKRRNVKGHHCGGTLINYRYVLTASHCVNGRGIPTHWRLTGVRLGEWDTSTNPDCEVDVRGERDCAPMHLDIGVERAITHPMYNPNSRNQVHDIALLRLEDSVTYSDFVRPICLPLITNLRTASLNGIIMDVAGWGKTETSSSSNIKLKAAVDGLTVESCRETYAKQNIIIENSQLCAGGKEGIDSCRGDSGGPLVTLDNTNRANAYYFLAGVVSFGPTPCGLAGWPGVYTRVGSYVDWIIQNIEK